jgi:hypothetical protein
MAIINFLLCCVLLCVGQGRGSSCAQKDFSELESKKRFEHRANIDFLSPIVV